MSHSNAIKLVDLRRIFRVLGDARALKHDKMMQEQVIVDGLCHLIGASMGWASGFKGFVPEKTTQIEHFVPGEVQDAHVLAVLGQWSRFHSLDEDPMVLMSCASTKHADVCCRSKRMTRSAWTKWEIYEQFVEQIGAIDSLVLWFRYPTSDRIRGYALQRCGDEREFSDRDVALARVFAEELYLLFEQEHLEPTAPDLPGRLMRLMPYLLGSKSQKQIALETGLSYQTVRSYTRELYDTLGVDSRQALISKCMQGL